MIKTFNIDTEYDAQETMDVVLGNTQGLVLKFTGHQLKRSKVVLRHDGYTQDYLISNQLAFPFPEEFIQPGLVDISIVEMSMDRPARIIPLPSILFVMNDSAFYGQDKFAELLALKPDLEVLLNEIIPEMRNDVNQLKEICGEPTE